MAAKVTINLNRLDHLMTLFRMSKGELLHIIGGKLVRGINEKDIFGGEIKLSDLKKIDKIFDKGLSYYIDPSDPIKSREESIFFRKDDFNAALNLGARQIVNRFEEEKIAFSTLTKLADIEFTRTIPFFKITDNPKKVANDLRERLYPVFTTDKREFLKLFIEKLSENNILVFEFVENHNKIQRANINGFYLEPDVIVLKRNQKSLSREIFTLAHELAHYLLNEEEIDNNIDFEKLDFGNLSVIERWCNDFAYFFLAGRYDNDFVTIPYANASNDYQHEKVGFLSSRTHLSSLALYTRMLLSHMISPADYAQVRDDIYAQISQREAAEKILLEKQKQKALDEGRVLIIPGPKPIISPLYSNTMQVALNAGLISEAEFCKKLNINPLKIDNYLL
ncbi:MAG: ImmA/IrrE family metallo-endopeptidase [Ferruginibacter sp.]